MPTSKLWSSAQVLSGDGSSISLNQFQIFGPSDFKPGTGPLCVFSQQDPASITEGGAQVRSPAAIELFTGTLVKSPTANCPPCCCSGRRGVMRAWA